MLYFKCCTLLSANYSYTVIDDSAESCKPCGCGCLIDSSVLHQVGVLSHCPFVPLAARELNSNVTAENLVGH